VRRASLAVAVALVIVGPVSAGVAFAGTHIVSGSYTGAVGPGYPLSFRVPFPASSVDDLVVSFDETCNGSPALTPPRFDFQKTLSITDDKFSGTSKIKFGTSGYDTLLLAGTFNKTGVVGTVKSTSFIKSLGTCTETETFTAALKK
jgi:hypothetical protein